MEMIDDNPDYLIDQPMIGDDGILSDDILSMIKSESLKTDNAHYDNLLDTLDDDKTKRLGIDVITWVRDDESAREEWIELEKTPYQLAYSPF